MRELKFRAWDKDYKGYCCGCDIGNLLTGLAYNNGRKSEIIKDKVLAKHFILEQYTGLKDKNGKEIYEGDIVRDSKGEKCLIKWTESEAHFGLYVGKGMELTDFVWMRGEYLEVIGNIHENPELLGEEEE